MAEFDNKETNAEAEAPNEVNGGQIIDVPLTKEMEQSFLDYS